MTGKHRAGAMRPLAQQAPYVSWNIETYYTERLMSVAEVAASLHVSDWTVRRWVHSGKLIPVGNGKIKRPGTRGRKGYYFTLSGIEHCRKVDADHGG